MKYLIKLFSFLFGMLDNAFDIGDELTEYMGSTNKVFKPFVFIIRGIFVAVVIIFIVCGVIICKPGYFILVRAGYIIPDNHERICDWANDNGYYAMSLNHVAYNNTWVSARSVRLHYTIVNS